MEAFTLSARKFEVWSSKQGSFGIDFNSIAEILVESIENCRFEKIFSYL